MIKRVDKAVDLTEELKKDVCGLRRGEAEPTCIKTSTRLIAKVAFESLINENDKRMYIDSIKT